MAYMANPFPSPRASEFFSPAIGEKCTGSDFEFHSDSCDYEDDSGSCLDIRVGSMKALRRLQSSAPRSSRKLFGHRSNILSFEEYAYDVLGFLPPKLRAKAAKNR